MSNSFRCSICQHNVIHVWMDSVTISLPNVVCNCLPSKGITSWITSVSSDWRSLVLKDEFGTVFGILADWVWVDKLRWEDTRKDFPIESKTTLPNGLRVSNVAWSHLFEGILFSFCQLFCNFCTSSWNSTTHSVLCVFYLVWKGGLREWWLIVWSICLVSCQDLFWSQVVFYRTCTRWIVVNGT